MFHHKGNGISFFPASKAFKEMFGWVHIKGCAFLIMKRTASQKAASLFLKFYIFADNIDDIQGLNIFKG